MLGMMGWVYNRIDKKFEKVDEKFKKIDEQFDKMDKKFDEKFEKIEVKLESMNLCLARLEGRFEERGYWESREHRKTGTEG